MTHANTILQKVNEIPPCVCRLLARKGWKPMSHADLAKASGLSKSTVAKISIMLTWDKVTFGSAFKFSKACGVDLLHPNKHWKTLKNRKTQYGRTTKTQRRMFARLIQKTASIKDH